MTHYVGQLVRVDCPISPAHGETVTIIALNCKGWASDCGDYIGHRVDYEVEHGHGLIFEPHELIPIDDDKRGSWDEIEKVTGWKPSIEVKA